MHIRTQLYAAKFLGIGWQVLVTWNHSLGNAVPICFFALFLEVALVDLGCQAHEWACSFSRPIARQKRADAAGFEFRRILPDLLAKILF